MDAPPQTATGPNRTASGDTNSAARRPPRVPDFELVRWIGRGSYGDVWLARDVFEQWRAVKVVYRDYFSDPRPFEREFEGLRLLRQARRAGFRIQIHYLWLPTVALALRRIRQRVRKGGHDVPEADVRRRFARSLRHFVKDYVPLAHRWAVWDNQTSPPRLLADSQTCSQEDLQRILWPD